MLPPAADAAAPRVLAAVAVVGRDPHQGGGWPPALRSPSRLSTEAPGVRPKFAPWPGASPLSY